MRLVLFIVLCRVRGTIFSPLYLFTGRFIYLQEYMSSGNSKSNCFPKEFLYLNTAECPQISCNNQLCPESLHLRNLYIFFNLNSNCILNVLKYKCRKQDHRESEESGQTTAVNRKITETDTKTNTQNVIGGDQP